MFYNLYTYHPWKAEQINIISIATLGIFKLCVTKKKLFNIGTD